MVGSSARPAVVALVACYLITHCQSGATASEPNTLAKDCKVWSQSAEGAGTKGWQVIGEWKALSPVTILRRPRKNIVEAEQGGMRGHISKDCLAIGLPMRKPGSVSSRGSGSASAGDPFRLGVAGSLDVNTARGSASASSATGVGFGVGVVGSLPLTRNFQLSLGSYVRQVTASRSVSQTGYIAESSEIVYSQTINFLTLQMVGQYSFRNFSIKKSSWEWWGDAGIEYLLPVSAAQTDPSGEVVTFTSTDRPLMLLLGVSALIPIEKDLSVIADFHGFYNVLATSGNSLAGVRMAFSLNLAL